LRLMICVYGRADPAVLIRIRLIFGSTIRPNTNRPSAFCPLFGAE